MKKKRTWIILAVVVFACSGLALAASQILSRQADVQALADAQIGQVQTATLSAVVESTGSVNAQAEVPLSFGASGTVAKVNVVAGDRVKQGDVLAELDTSSLALQVKQAEQVYLLQQATYSATVQADPDSIASAQAAVNSASAAYQNALVKYDTRDDKVTSSCANVDDAKTTLDDAQTAYTNYLSDWRVQVYGSYEVSPQKAQLERAQAAYDQALARCATTKGTINTSAVQSARSDLEQAQATLADLVSPNPDQLAAAKAQVEQARLAWEQAKVNLSNARIIAPFDGYVVEVNMVVGQTGSQATTITVADLSQYHLEVLIDETEIGKVQADQAAEVTFDALPETRLTGRVARIDPAGTVNQGVINYQVRIDLDPTEAALRIDMTGNVRILYETHANVLAVPTAAIRTDEATGQSYVELAELPQQNAQGGQSSSAQRVTVTTGLTDGDLTEVSGRLQAGQAVFISEAPRLSAGRFNPFSGPPPGFGP
jgi:HlyD family secretion protein